MDGSFLHGLDKALAILGVGALLIFASCLGSAYLFGKHTGRSEVVVQEPTHEVIHDDKR